MLEGFGRSASALALGGTGGGDVAGGAAGGAVYVSRIPRVIPRRDRNLRMIVRGTRNFATKFAPQFWGAKFYSRRNFEARILAQSSGCNRSATGPESRE